MHLVGLAQQAQWKLQELQVASRVVRKAFLRATFVITLCSMLQHPHAVRPLGAMSPSRRKQKQQKPHRWKLPNVPRCEGSFFTSDGFQAPRPPDFMRPSFLPSALLPSSPSSESQPLPCAVLRVKISLRLELAAVPRPEAKGGRPAAGPEAQPETPRKTQKL